MSPATAALAVVADVVDAMGGNATQRDAINGNAMLRNAMQGDAKAMECNGMQRNTNEAKVHAPFLRWTMCDHTPAKLEADHGEN